jgi:hypothetical protein
LSRFPFSSQPSRCDCVLYVYLLAPDGLLGSPSCREGFFSSAVLSLASTRRRLKKDKARHGALLKENERLRSLLAQAEEDNARLRELHGYSGRLRREIGVARDAA